MKLHIPSIIRDNWYKKVGKTKNVLSVINEEMGTQHFNSLSESVLQWKHFQMRSVWTQNVDNLVESLVQPDDFQWEVDLGQIFISSIETITMIQFSVRMF